MVDSGAEEFPPITADNMLESAQDEVVDLEAGNGAVIDIFETSMDVTADDISSDDGFGGPISKGIGLCGLGSFGRLRICRTEACIAGRAGVRAAHTGAAGVGNYSGFLYTWFDPAFPLYRCGESRPRVTNV